MPLEQALTAVDGWGGDSYVAYERDGVSCLKANYRGDTPEDLVQMKTALEAWVRKLPEGSASVTRDGIDLLFSPATRARTPPRWPPGSRWTRSRSR